jgi:signal transduction histidine kinase
MTSHPLLDRLLRRAGVAAGAAPSGEVWQGLVPSIAQAFITADIDRRMLERSMDVCSQEMQGLYQELQRRSESELAAERTRVAESLAVLRATLESTNQGIVVVDRQRRVIASNTKYLEIFSVPPEIAACGDQAAILARSVQAFRDPEAAAARISAIHETDHVVHDELVLADDRIITRYSTPVRLPDGTHVGRVTFFCDVTDERLIQAEREQARLAAEAASRAKSMFLANMSHELRTPLNAVIGLTDLLLLEGGDPLTAKQARYLEAIVESGRHLLMMVNDVLDLARIEAGRHEIDPSPIGATEAVGGVVSLLSQLAASRGVGLDAEVPADLRLVADPLRLRQILLNLVGNAIKFTDHGGHVRVAAARRSDRVEIAVADTGIGIAPQDMARLFKPFEQLALPSGDRPPGTGLGLALTKQLVDLHGGSIEVASELGVGTTFTVSLRAA